LVVIYKAFNRYIYGQRPELASAGIIPRALFATVSGRANKGYKKETKTAIYKDSLFHN